MRIWWEENNLDGIEIFEREVVRERVWVEAIVPRGESFADTFSRWWSLQEQQLESIYELISQAKEAVCTPERKVPETPYEGNVLLYGANC
jgi:hypothetical protein